MCSYVPLPSPLPPSPPRETIMAYEASQTVTSDDDMSHISGLTSDLLSTMSTRHRHTSRHSLLDEIIKQVSQIVKQVDPFLVQCTMDENHISLLSGGNRESYIERRATHVWNE